MMVLPTSSISNIFKAASQHIFKKSGVNVSGDLHICNHTTENEANSDFAALLQYIIQLCWVADSTKGGYKGSETGRRTEMMSIWSQTQATKQGCNDSWSWHRIQCCLSVAALTWPLWKEGSRSEVSISECVSLFFSSAKSVAHTVWMRVSAKKSVHTHQSYAKPPGNQRLSIVK